MSQVADPRRARPSAPRIYRDLSILWGILVFLLSVVLVETWFIFAVRIANPTTVDLSSAKAVRRSGGLPDAPCSRVTPEDLLGIQDSAVAFVRSYAEENDLGPHTTAVLVGFVGEYISTVNSFRLFLAWGLDSETSVEQLVQTERLHAVMGTSILLGDAMGVAFEEELDRRWRADWNRLDPRPAEAMPVTGP